MQSGIPLEHNNIPAYRLPKATPILIVIELVIVIVMALVVARPYADFRPDLRIAGNEAEYLQSSVYTASNAIRKLGYLPYWQPWLEKGEPLLNSPFSMLFNPLSTWPGLLYGANNGIKLSMILTILFSGLGGWVLARVLGMRSLARILLAALCIGRGSMHGVLVPGFFPLTMSQSYFPWILAGTLAILWFKQQRWPIVLTALMFNLMFWVGLMWYVPAITLAIGLLTLIHVVVIRVRDEATGRFTLHVSIDWMVIRRLFLTAILTLGLSALTLIPLISFSRYFGKTTILADPLFRVDRIVDTYFNPVPKTEFGGGNQSAAFYAYISPWWYLGVLAAGMVFTLLLKRSGRIAAYRRTFIGVMVVAGLLIVFYTLWGAGQNPIIEWSYGNVPFATHFRHTERVLAVGAFFISIVIAAAFDYIWYQLRSAVWRFNLNGRPKLILRGVQSLLALAFLSASVVAGHSVVRSWFVYGPALQAENTHVDSCLGWLRFTYPDQPLSVWTTGYTEINSYLETEIRHSNITTDFYKPMPLASTIYRYNISTSYPRYAQPWGDWNFDYIKALNYQRNPELPMDTPERPCFFERTSYYPYAFAVPKSATDNDQKIPPEATTKIETLHRRYDRVAVLIDGDPNAEKILTVSELAFPGWTVQVDGMPAKLEIFGGYVSVVLPPGTTQYQVLFQYRPPEFFIGAAIMLVTWAICVLFLLHLRIPIRRQR